MKDYAATHQRVMATAEQLFAERGYASAAVADICGAAGVSKGAFYHHFSSKQALFLEILAGWLGMLDDALEGSAQGTVDVPEALRRMAGVVAGSIEASGDRLPMLLEFWAQARRDPAVWHVVVAPYQRYQAYFTGLLQRGMEERALRPINAVEAARQLISLALGLLMQAMFDPQAEDWAEVFRRTFELHIDGLHRRDA